MEKKSITDSALLELVEKAIADASKESNQDCDQAVAEALGKSAEKQFSN